MDDRVASDKEEGDIAYFQALALQLEYLTKLVTAGVVACVADDAERHRYSLEHKLVRADSLGDWLDALISALTGPAAQSFLPQATSLARQLTERVGETDWRHAAVSKLQAVAGRLGLDQPVGAKVALRQAFQVGSAIRNRTRGHGATTGSQCTQICPDLADAICLIQNNLDLLQLPWAYLHRNLNGKYRVSPLMGDCSAFDYLKRTREVVLSNGVFIYLGRPVAVTLIFSDTEAEDVSLPNGNFRSGSFEVLSYVTNDVARRDGAAWTVTPGPLPASESEGASVLERFGNTFANLPPLVAGYVPRTGLENRLQDELKRTDRHPIVTLTGPGGIGKTTLAIAAIDAIAKATPSPYDVIVWLSARDIDLMDTGPKPVTPRVIRKNDIARALVALLEPAERETAGFSADLYAQRCLASGAAGPTLFVFDNFETIDSPSDVFAWIDTHIRAPNKALITTRFRDFVGDYPIEIGGMTDDESLDLISRHSRRLGIERLLDGDYRRDLIRESDGHPYVIKILLGRVAQEGQAVSPERIVASSDHLLAALFERTYDKLSPAGQRVFLLLCSWRVFVPLVAVEAVSLRPGNERFDVSAALAELRRFSLTEEVESTSDSAVFVGVPLTAAAYGRRKLEASPFKAAVEEDRKLLMEFGAGKREDANRGVLPRVDRLIKGVASKVGTDRAALDSFLPILEYVASRVPQAYLLLAHLMEEVGDPASTERAKTYLRRFLEVAQPEQRINAWARLADLCHSTKDVVGEVHALAEAALLPTVQPDDLGTFANRINNRIKDLRGRRMDDAWSPEVRLLIERVAAAMDRHIRKLTATDCSRLAWLYLNIGNEARARDVVEVGIQLDKNNEHCQNLINRLQR
jgi:hypothetical protein